MTHNCTLCKIKRKDLKVPFQLCTMQCAAQDKMCKVLAGGGADGGVRGVHGDQRHGGDQQGLHPQGVPREQGGGVSQGFPLSFPWLA